MLWPLLTIVAFAALLLVHLRWRARYQALEVSAHRDTEQLKHTHQQEAAHAQNRQEALFDSMAEGLLLLDVDGRFQLANRAFQNLFGVAGHVRSRTIMEALRLHELAELVDSLGQQKHVMEHELKLSRPNERWLQVNGAALFNGGGHRQGTVLVFHDLTRLKQLERTRQEFVANVSHELRTPLSLIKGYAETLLDGARENPEVATKFLQTIDRNAERLKLLIEDLLTISELESGRVQLNLQSVELRALVEKVMGDFKAKTDGKKMLMTNGAGPELRVRADPDRLEQVLGNLIDNAIKYGRSEGSIAVQARSLDEGQVEVAVLDDGPGIPRESLERVFERFYRVDKARSREQGGTGLGLSIVKHIVQSHGGKVWATSELGHGASFFFTLPQDSGAVQQPLL